MNENKRIFVALNFDDNFEAALYNLASSLKFQSFRNIPKEQLHLTLYFNPSAHERDIENIIYAMKGMADYTSFVINTAGLLVFPKLCLARVIAVEIGEGKKDCVELYKLFTEKLFGALAGEKRRFHPHVSLLRKLGSQKNTRINCLPEIPQIRGKCVNCSLYESILKSKGSEYFPIFKTTFL